MGQISAAICVALGFIVAILNFKVDNQPLTNEVRGLTRIGFVTALAALPFGIAAFVFGP